MNDPFYEILPFLFWTMMLMGAVGWTLSMCARNLESWINK